MLLNRRCLALPALAAALLGSSVAAFAQSAAPPAGPGQTYGAPAGAPPPAGGPRRRHGRGPLRRALKGLALSPDQRTRIARLMHDYRASRRNGTPESRAAVVAQIDRVLTPDERSAFQRRLHRAHRPPAHPGGEQAPKSTP